MYGDFECKAVIYVLDSKYMRIWESGLFSTPQRPKSAHILVWVQVLTNSAHRGENGYNRDFLSIFSFPWSALAFHIWKDLEGQSEPSEVRQRKTVQPHFHAEPK